MKCWILCCCFLIGCCFLGFEVSPASNVSHPSSVVRQSVVIAHRSTYGFELMRDHDSRIIIYRVDSLSDAYSKGIRPGLQVIGWNTLPIERKLASLKIRTYRRSFPGWTDEKIRMQLLIEAKSGETAEVFFMTATENNWGVRVVAR